MSLMIAAASADTRFLSFGRERGGPEQILALGAHFCWEECWGSGLQPYGLNPEAITGAAQAVAVHQAELTRITHELRTLEQQQAEALARARPARTGTPDLEQLLTANALGLEIQHKLRQELKAKDDLATAIANLEQARATKVALPEDMTGEHYDRQLAAALAASEKGNASKTKLPTPAPMAEELAVSDIAELFGVQPMQARRWRAGTSNPPINPKHWIKINEKDWRFPVSAIDAQALKRIPASDPQEALKNIRRRRAAIGFAARKRQKRQPIAADT